MKQLVESTRRAQDPEGRFAPNQRHPADALLVRAFEQIARTVLVAEVGVRHRQTHRPDKFALCSPLEVGKKRVRFLSLAGRRLASARTPG